MYVHLPASLTWLCNLCVMASMSRSVSASGLSVWETKELHELVCSVGGASAVSRHRSGPAVALRAKRHVPGDTQFLRLC